MKTRKTLVSWFDDDYNTFTIKAESYLYPGDPGRRYMPNGDPGYPPSDPELDEVSVWLIPKDKDGNEQDDKKVEIGELLAHHCPDLLERIEEQLHQDAEE